MSIDMIGIRFIVPDTSVIIFISLHDVDKGTGVPGGGGGGGGGG